MSNLTTKPDVQGAHGAFDTTAASKPTSKTDRRLYIISLRFTEQEILMLRAAMTEEHPTVTEVIRSRVFLPPIKRYD